MAVNMTISNFKFQNAKYEMLFFVLCILQFAVCVNGANAHLPMETEYAETLPKDSWEVRLHGGYMDMSSGENNWMKEQMYELNAGYGLTRDLSLYIQPTYKVKEMEMSGGGMIMKESASGVGDTDVLARYRFRKKDREGGSCQQALLLGLKLPTGAWNIEENGTRLMDMVQPGTGSTDYSAGLAVTHRKGNFTLDGDVIYTINTENQKDYKFGNLLRYDLAGLYQINDTYLMLELNGRVAEKDDVSEANGINRDNTGGHQIFINPGVSYHVLPNTMLMLSVQVPIYTDMNGEAQKTNYHAMGGLHWYY